MCSTSWRRALYCTVLYCTELRVCVQYKLEASPTPSDEEDESSDEEDAFGPKKEKVEEDPVKSKACDRKYSMYLVFPLLRSETNGRESNERPDGDG